MHINYTVLSIYNIPTIFYTAYNSRISFKIDMDFIFNAFQFVIDTHSNKTGSKVYSPRLTRFIQILLFYVAIGRFLQTLSVFGPPRRQIDLSLAVIMGSALFS